MEILWQELTSGLPDTQQLIHVIIRMIAAVMRISLKMNTNFAINNCLKIVAIS